MAFKEVAQGLTSSLTNILLAGFPLKVIDKGNCRSASSNW